MWAQIIEIPIAWPIKAAPRYGKAPVSWTALPSSIRSNRNLSCCHIDWLQASQMVDHQGVQTNTSLQAGKTDKGNPQKETHVICFSQQIVRLCDAGGKIGIIDYGQSKQLPPRDRLALANLIIALVDKDLLRVSQTMDKLGIKTSSKDAAVRAKFAYGMFDTSLK